MKAFRVVITGAASFDNYERLCKKCLYMLQRKLCEPDTEVIILTGLFNKVEKLAYKFAKENLLKVECYPIDNSLPFRKAEPAQCQQIINIADALIAFDGPPYPNHHMVHLRDRAILKGIPVRTIN